MKRAQALFASLLAIALAIGGGRAIAQQVVRSSGTVANVGDQVSALCNGGQSSAEVYAGAGLTGTITVYIATNVGSAALPTPGPTASPNWVAAAGGSTYQQTISSFPGRLYVSLASSAYVFAVVTAASGGSAPVYVTCTASSASGGAGGGGGGGGGNSTIVAPTTAAGAVNVHDVSPVQPSPLYTMPVTTPAPGPTCSPGNLPCGGLTGPPTPQPAINGADQAVVDANGVQRTSIADPSTGQAVPVTNASNSPIPAAANPTVPVQAFLYAVHGANWYPIGQASGGSGNALGVSVCASNVGSGGPCQTVLSGVLAALTADPCANTSLYFQSSTTLTVNTVTQIVALTAGKTIWVCNVSGYQTGTGLTAVDWFSGTGTNCGTGTANIHVTPMQTATAGYWDNYGQPFFQTASAAALCVEALGTTSTASNVSLRYVVQ